ncbi:MAG: TIGR00341 family protein [Armatimonadetes bacterium]|nr:TIGR00341 family protein [Armatimonadota bacterium]
MARATPAEHSAEHTARLQTAYDAVVEMARGDRAYYVLAALSAAIASFGLLANSTAVVIGAMIVAPLMGPILGLALGLAAGDRRLAGRALVTESLGVLLCLLLAYLIGRVPLSLGLGSEVMARTQPTLYDILIALAAGCAGAYAMADARVSTSLPGVAIAVALVPPLATCGLCLGAHRPELAKGAMLLFLANLVAIQMAASLLFLVTGIAQCRGGSALSAGRLLRRFGISLLALVAVTVFMTRTFLGLIADRHFRDQVEQRVVAALGQTAGAQLDSLTYDRGPEQTDVVAVVLTPQEFAPRQVAEIEQDLRRGVDPRIHLVVRSLSSKDADANGPVYTLRAKPDQETTVTREAKMLKEATSVLSERLGAVSGAELVSLRRRDEAGQLQFVADVRTPELVVPDQVADLQAALSEKLGRPTRLVVRSVLARVATSQGFVDPDLPPEPTGAELALLRRLQQALANQVALRHPTATVSTVRPRVQPHRLLVYAEVETPWPIEPAEVQAMQQALRTYVRPDISLLIKSVISPVAGANGFVPVEAIPPAGD